MRIKEHGNLDQCLGRYCLFHDVLILQDKNVVMTFTSKPLILKQNGCVLRIDTGGCSVIRATPVFNYIAHLHSSIRI